MCEASDVISSHGQQLLPPLEDHRADFDVDANCGQDDDPDRPVESRNSQEVPLKRNPAPELKRINILLKVQHRLDVPLLCHRPCPVREY